MSGCWGCVCGLTLEEGGVGRVGMGWDIVVKDLGMYGGVFFLSCSVRGGELGKERGRGKWVLGL